MLSLQLNDRKAYEFSVYNKNVRAALKDNQSHLIYGDHWADPQIQDIAAYDEREAKELIAKRYPPEEGFVVADITPAHH